MKAWPDKGVAPFDEIVESVMEMMEAFDIVDKGEDRPYSGLPLGSAERRFALSPAELMDPGDNDYLREKIRGDRLRRVVEVAIQLGIEQGRRVAAREP